MFGRRKKKEEREKAERKKIEAEDKVSSMLFTIGDIVVRGRVDVWSNARVMIDGVSLMRQHALNLVDKWKGLQDNQIVPISDVIFIKRENGAIVLHEDSRGFVTGKNEDLSKIPISYMPKVEEYVMEIVRAIDDADAVPGRFMPWGE